MEILAILSTVAPGVVSVIGILAMILSAVSKFTKVILEFKENKDTLIEELRKSDSEYKTQINTLVQQNKELSKTCKFLTDKIAKIKGYSDTKGA